jgi:hypothetical protein
MFKKSSIVLATLLIVAGLAGCGAEQEVNTSTTVTVPATLAPVVTPMINKVSVTTGNKMGQQSYDNYTGPGGGNGGLAQTLRVDPEGVARVDTVRLCLMSDVSRDGVPDSVNPVISAYAYDGAYSIPGVWVEVKMVNGLVELWLDTRVFATVPEFFVHIYQHVPAGEPLTTIRLVPNPNGVCGRTGVALQGNFVDQDVSVNITPSETATFTPTSVPPTGGKG